MKEFRISKILDPTWFYDELINQATEELRAANHIYESKLKIETSFISANIDLEKRILDHTGELQLKIQEAIRKNNEGLAQNLYIQKGTYANVKKTATKLREFKESKPFFIGPATLDALVNVKPESYECVKEFRIPFKNIFFEFSEPFEMGIPFSSSMSKARGLQLLLSTSTESERPVYSIGLYYQKDKEENIPFVQLIHTHLILVEGVFQHQE